MIELRLSQPVVVIYSTSIFFLSTDISLLDEIVIIFPPLYKTYCKNHITQGVLFKNNNLIFTYFDFDKI